MYTGETYLNICNLLLMRPRPCLQCKKLRKHCTLERPSCARCATKNQVCQYEGGFDEFYEHQVKQSTNGPTRLPAATALERIMTISDIPIEQGVSGSSCLQHPDLLPTMADWAVITSFIPNHPFHYRHSFCSLDPMQVVVNFWTEAPELRLIYCAMSAHMMQPRLPDSVCFSYYERAKLALSKCDTPSIKTIQALLVALNFTLLNGQPMIGIPLFYKAFDPDDSPWLKYLNYLNQKKKLGGELPHSLSSSRLPLFISAVSWTLSKTSVLMFPIPQRFWIGTKKYHPPPSNSSPEKINMHIQQVERSGLLNMNLFSRSASSALSRPLLYLTAFLLPETHPLDYTPDAVAIISKAMASSLKNAQEIADINTALLNATTSSNNKPYLSPPQKLCDEYGFWKEHMLVYLAFFEAAVVMWFYTCKSNSHWKQLYCMGSLSIDMGLQSRFLLAVTDILRTFCILESALAVIYRPEKANMMTGLVDCVEDMLREMKSVSLVMDGRLLDERMSRFSGSVVPSLLDSSNDHGMKAPWIFVGLLGFKVNNSRTIQNKSETEWANFWSSLRIK
ncbi:hypothetical protein BDR26DRAFT_851076 [Obelidium mucronatum]|nr:hypothetical protein BDR26DRAFT_851076 [Obelidium mucronatum]